MAIGQVHVGLRCWNWKNCSPEPNLFDKWVRCQNLNPITWSIMCISNNHGVEYAMTYSSNSFAPSLLSLLLSNPFTQTLTLKLMEHKQHILSSPLRHFSSKVESMFDQLLLLLWLELPLKREVLWSMPIAQRTTLFSGCLGGVVNMAVEEDTPMGAWEFLVDSEVMVDIKEATRVAAVDSFIGRITVLKGLT